MVGTSDIPDWCFVEAMGAKGPAAYTETPSAADLEVFLAASPISHASKVRHNRSLSGFFVLFCFFYYYYYFNFYFFSPPAFFSLLQPFPIPSFSGPCVGGASTPQTGAAVSIQMWGASVCLCWGPGCCVWGAGEGAHSLPVGRPRRGGHLHHAQGHSESALRCGVQVCVCAAVLCALCGVQVKVPTLFLLGGQDRRVPPSNGMQVSAQEVTGNQI